MNKLQQSFLYTIYIITIYYTMNIIYYIYYQGNYSIFLSKDMVPWEYYFLNVIGTLIIFTITFLLVFNFQKYIKYSKTKNINDLFDEITPNKFQIILNLILLELISILYMINFKLVQTIDKVLDFYWIKKGITGLKTNTSEIQSQLLTEDYIYMLLPLIFLLFIKSKLNKNIFKHLKYTLITTISLIILIFYFNNFNDEKKISSMNPNLLNPFIQLYFDATNLLNSNSIPNINFDKKQINSLKIIDENLLEPSKEIIELKTNSKPKNAIIILIESAGFEFVFNTKENQKDIKQPMPFLYKLSQEGVWCKNTYSNSASTGQATLAITTGLNLYAGSDTVYSKTLNFPTINKYTNKNVFFEHASNMKTWFPYYLLKNNNMKTIDMFDMKKKNYPIVKNLAIDENYAFDDFINNFIQDVKNGKETIGYYLNYSTHFPYFNYKKGKYKTDNKQDMEKLLNASNSKVSKLEYYKSLNYFDLKLKEMFNKLKKENILDDTIIVILGDHGQSFGKHGVWTHGDIYNNIAKIPMLIWQPKYIKHKIISKYISQADIFPTILDLLKIKYNDNKIQGISLFKPIKRKYIYTRGYHYQLTDTDRNIKMVLNNDNTKCEIFDENTDTEELKPLSCKGYEKMKNLLYKYINYQNEILIKYKKELENLK